MDRIYFSDGKPHFKEFGFYKGIDVKRKPANNTNIFFSNVFKTALDYFLEEKYKEGLQKIIEGDKILQERILRTSKKLPVCEDEITDLIYYNKSRNWYKGIVDGKKQAFALPNAYDFEIDEHGKPFIEMKSDGKKEILPILEDGKGKYFDLIASGKVERVRIQGFENYFPDYTGYLDEYRRKIKGFAKGALIKLAESKNEDDKKVFIEATRLLNAKAGVIPVNANTPKSQTKTKKSRRQSNPNEIQGILNL
jgi:hypothetical protein